MQRQKIYLAGPEVFLPNAVEIGKRLKYDCELCLAEGLFPLDNEVGNDLAGEDLARAIVYGNMEMIRKSDYVFADLSNFRGTEAHPQCDSGTAWECGYAISLGKKVIGYTDNPSSVPKTILNNIHLLVKFTPDKNGIAHIFDIIHNLEFRDIVIQPDNTSDEYNLDPPHKDIKDASAETAFLLGGQFALGNVRMAKLSDTRTQIEKYGETDDIGCTVENFGYPVNIMIAVNTII